jgi:predicted nucleic-acid-binding Zn-ribbon protein
MTDTSTDVTARFDGFWKCDKCGPSFAVVEEIAGPPRPGRPPELVHVQGWPVARCLRCGWSNFAVGDRTIQPGGESA